MHTIPENIESKQNQITHDVIISGAGPVGLFLACELALAKCSVLMLEKSEHLHSPLKQLPFGMRGLSAPSVESLYRRDLLQDLQVHKHVKIPPAGSATSQGAKSQGGGHFAGIPLNHAKIDTSQWRFRLPSSTDNQLLSEMEELEMALTHRAESLGVTICRGNAVTGFRQTADTVIVQSGNRLFTGSWLVGCDGSRSVVRKAGGFEFSGTEPEFTGYTALVDIADPEKLKFGRNMTSAGMYMQFQPGYIIMQEFDGGAFRDSGKPITLEQIEGLLRRVSNTDVTLTTLHHATTWTDRTRQATAYRNDRVLLAGDAAHIHSPLGGQGLNLGLGDAMNLGWKLAAAIHNKAPEGLLDTYQTERHPIGARVLDWSRAQVATMKPEPAARALQAIVRDLMDTSDGATYFAERVWGISIHYDLGGIHPIVGYSVPNFEFEDGAKLGGMMHDGTGILLDFDKNESLHEWAHQYDSRIKYISGKAKFQLDMSAMLIRPDGVVAWATDADPDISELEKAADRWFSDNSEAMH